MGVITRQSCQRRGGCAKLARRQSRPFPRHAGANNNKQALANIPNDAPVSVLPGRHVPRMAVATCAAFPRSHNIDLSVQRGENMDQDFITAALDYHRSPTRGKISVVPTKGLTNQRDLALAYSPGVAAACDAIVADPAEAFELTSRGNLVAVVTNGTAVLGLGNIGPLASKPVMEGKGCLFKKFANIDVFDIELAENDPDKLIEIIAALEPTLGGINLEDIKAPECFYIEKKLRERMKIPVFHDDQHGTAIVVGAAVLNALKVVGKDIDSVNSNSSVEGAEYTGVLTEAIVTVQMVIAKADRNARFFFILIINISFPFSRMLIYYTTKFIIKQILGFFWQVKDILNFM